MKCQRQSARAAHHSRAPLEHLFELRLIDVRTLDLLLDEDVEFVQPGDEPVEEGDDELHVIPPLSRRQNVRMRWLDHD